MNSGYDAVRRFSREKGKEWETLWASVIKAAYEVAGEATEFAGAWVLKHMLEDTNDAWFPSLRSPAAFGIVEKTDSARGGRRAYYRMPDRVGVARALRELGILE